MTATTGTLAALARAWRAGDLEVGPALHDIIVEGEAITADFIEGWQGCVIALNLGGLTVAQIDKEVRGVTSYRDPAPGEEWSWYLIHPGRGEGWAASYEEARAAAEAALLVALAQATGSDSP